MGIWEIQMDPASGIKPMRTGMWSDLIREIRRSHSSILIWIIKLAGTKNLLHLFIEIYLMNRMKWGFDADVCK